MSSNISSSVLAPILQTVVFSHMIDSKVFFFFTLALLLSVGYAVSNNLLGSYLYQILRLILQKSLATRVFLVSMQNAVLASKL